MDLAIGIDPGTDTGIAVWDLVKRQLVEVSTMKIHKAFKLIEGLSHENAKIHVRIEDARLRKWFGENSNAKKQGAGSIKRDCTIWEHFLTDMVKNEKINSFQFIAPKAIKTKLSIKQFQLFTKYTKRTSNHARDATMLVFGLSKNQLN